MMEPDVKGYLLARVHVRDPERFKIYSAQATSLVERFGGHFLVRGGKHEAVEGAGGGDRCVVIEFASLAAARQFYRSPAYQKILPIRQMASSATVVLVEGIQ